MPKHKLPLGGGGRQNAAKHFRLHSIPAQSKEQALSLNGDYKHAYTSNGMLAASNIRRVRVPLSLWFTEGAFKKAY